MVGGFSRGSPVSPALSFRRCSILTSITLIGSQDLALWLPSKHDLAIPRACNNICLFSLLTMKGPRWCSCQTTRQVRFPARSLPHFRKWESCRTVPLVGGFSRGPPVFPPCIPALLRTHLASPLSALKTSILRAAQISSLIPLVDMVCDTSWVKVAQSSPSTVKADNQWAVDIAHGVNAKCQGHLHLTWLTRWSLADLAKIGRVESLVDPPTIELRTSYMFMLSRSRGWYQDHADSIWRLGDVATWRPAGVGAYFPVPLCPNADNYSSTAASHNILVGNTRGEKRVTAVNFASCTPVQSLAHRSDGALGSRVSVALIALFLFPSLKRAKKPPAGDAL
ncbi:hypothetical protein PR048_031524 [Dryococelus australis]|uniref:Prolyl 4-hydroxylase alpha subunit Fe(2+) 2OG dioxygenase domain-containing protein n=1 Tax=Dryococelus australis TaxID=614101 RepID=A0ABQ9G9K4_9NEOP|nr:hypothetical protein PR048_031524 [Dryococelus australis]